MSNADKAVCKIDHLGTTFSNDKYGVETDDNNLLSGIYFGNGRGARKSFNGINNDKNGLNRNPCWVGMKFRPGFVGILTQVKFFLD